MEKSTYTIHLYKYKNTRIGLCIIFLLSFSFTKVLYVQTMARDGGTVYCITITIFHVSLFSTRPVSVLGPCMCRLWPMAEPIHTKYKKNQCGPGCLTGKLQNQSRLNGPGESRARVRLYLLTKGNKKIKMVWKARKARERTFR